MGDDIAEPVNSLVMVAIAVVVVPLMPVVLQATLVVSKEIVSGFGNLPELVHEENFMHDAASNLWRYLTILAPLS